MGKLKQFKLLTSFSVLIFFFAIPLNDLAAQIVAELERLYICKGDCADWEAIVTAGEEPLSYLWSTGEETEKITVCPTSNTFYQLTITDANEDSLFLNELVVVAPIDVLPTPSLTTPSCVGETVYFYQNNLGHSPSYHWQGPNGNEFFTKDPRIENVSLADAGEYTLYLNYYDLCVTDTVSVFLEIEDIDARSSCDLLSECNFACNIFEIFALRGRTRDEISGGVQPSDFCSDDGSGPSNISWFGFVAQQGDHEIRFRALNCEGNTTGLRFGLYDDCDFSNLIMCSETCTEDSFVIPSSILTPGQTYYAYADGCGGNVCDYSVLSEGSMQSIYCNDYIPFQETTDWKVHVSDLSGGSNFWYNYLKDTLIDGQVYRKIGINGASHFSELFLREEFQERKVYSYNKWNNSVKLHYDFSLELGDSYTDPVNGHSFTVTDITFVPSNIGPLKKWKLNGGFPGMDMYYTEAIGGNNLAFPADILISDPVYGTSTVYSNCQIIIGDEAKAFNRFRSQLDTTYISICEGEEYMGLTESIIINDTLTKEGGCLSMESLSLNVIPPTSIEMDTSICEGEEYLGLEVSGSYTFTETDPATGCDLLRIVHLEVIPIDSLGCVSATSEINKTKISIHPNPVTHEIYLKGLHALDGLKIYSAQGQLCMQKQIGSVANNKIDVSSLEAGVYFIIIKSMQSSIALQFVKF